MINAKELINLAHHNDAIGNYKEADQIDMKLMKCAQELPPEETQEDRVYRIPDQNLPKVQGLIDKLNRRAAKLKQPPVTVEMVGKDQAKIKDELGFDRIQTYTLIKIHGTPPKINGWSFVGTIAHHPSGHNIIKGVPGYEIPQHFRDRGSICEHCKTDRRRNDTMLLMDENGNYKQVGRQCIKDFLGHADPRAEASYAEYLQDLYQSASDYEEDEERMRGGRNTGQLPYDLMSFLTIAAAWVRQHGYISKAKASEDDTLTATSGQVNSILTGTDKYAVKDRGALLNSITPADEAIAEEAVEWIRSLAADEKFMQSASDYMYNIITAVQTNVVDKYTFGLLLSLIPAYFKHKEGELRKAKEKEEATNKLPENPYVGEIGQRVPLTLTVIAVRSYQTAYGTTFVNMMQDQEGRYVTWKGNQSLEQGSTYSMQAKVISQEQDKYNKNLPTTYIQRPTKITDLNK